MVARKKRSQMVRVLPDYLRIMTCAGDESEKQPFHGLYPSPHLRLEQQGTASFISAFTGSSKTCDKVRGKPGTWVPKSHKLIDMVFATLRLVASALAITRQRNLPEPSRRYKVLLLCHQGFCLQRCLLAPHSPGSAH